MEQIDVGRKILQEDSQWAAKNSQILYEHKITCLNLISSPGAGKTSILVQTIQRLAGRLHMAVIEGDIETDIDTKRIAQTGIAAVQINTKGACHLSAAQVHQALLKLPLSELDLVFIENVGNLVCPSVFDLGEHGKVAVLSTPEGDDKPAKYPGIFARSTVVLVNKIDLLGCGAVGFDLGRAISLVRQLNRNAQVMAISSRTGEGMEQWYGWIQSQVALTKRWPATI